MQPLSNNPYQSPSADSPPNSTSVYKPRLVPRDVVDWLMGAMVAAPLGGVIASGVVLACITTCRRLNLGEFWEFASILTIFSTFLVIMYSVGIQSVSMLDSGLQYRRNLGGTHLVAWKDIQGARLAARMECLVAGLMFPHRFCTMSATFRHCRIECVGGFIYFPPKDILAFLEAIGKHQQAAAELTDT